MSPVNTIDLSPLGGGNDGLQAEAHITSLGRVSAETTGQSLSPAYTFESERSLGLYRSAASTLALSYGTLSITNLSSATGVSTGPEYFPSGSAVAPSVAYSSENSLGWYRSGASAMALSYGTLDLFTGKAAFSIQTLGAASGMTVGQLAIIFQASGCSLAYSSGKTTYFFGGSTLSAVQS